MKSARCSVVESCFAFVRVRSLGHDYFLLFAIFHRTRQRRRQPDHPPLCALHMHAICTRVIGARVNYVKCPKQVSGVLRASLVVV